MCLQRRTIPRFGYRHSSKNLHPQPRGTEATMKLELVSGTGTVPLKSASVCLHCPDTSAVGTALIIQFKACYCHRSHRHGSDEDPNSLSEPMCVAFLRLFQAQGQRRKYRGEVLPSPQWNCSLFNLSQAKQHHSKPHQLAWTACKSTEYHLIPWTTECTNNGNRITLLTCFDNSNFILFIMIIHKAPPNAVRDLSWK